MLQLLIGEIFLIDALKCGEGFFEMELNRCYEESQ